MGFVGGEHAGETEDAVVVYEGAEGGGEGVALDPNIGFCERFRVKAGKKDERRSGIPIHHVSAKASAHSYGTICIYELHFVLDVFETIYEVFVAAFPPITYDTLYEILTKACRSCRVRHDDYISLFSENGRVPTRAPCIHPTGYGATMYPE